MKTIAAKFSILFSLALMDILAWAAPSTPIDPAHYPAPVRVACVGDSITEGYGIEKGKTYPDQLQALLGDKWQVKNFGLGGRTALKNSDRPYWIEKIFQDAKDFKPNVVIILLGANDARPPNWPHHGEFYSDYKDLVETFKNLDSKPRVFICRPCPVPEPGNFGITETDIQIEIPLINKVAAAENVDIIDMHAALAGKPNLLFDRVHPNAAGAGVMAQTIVDAFNGKTAKAP